ncbi:DUF6233 domain-containing protein [Streptomyces microflavus]|uniref:DUF6233 domain-containing protein n=1 Tax=Streptomyces microflavus TaxID=1919 RepID=UPI0036472818
MAGSGGISRLEKWRITRDFLAWQPQQAEQRVRVLGAQEEKQRRRSRRARAEQLGDIEPQRSGSVTRLHRGDGSVTRLHRGGCGLFDNAGAPIDREAALAGLREPDVETCPVRAPETGLTEQ